MDSVTAFIMNAKAQRDLKMATDLMVLAVKDEQVRDWAWQMSDALRNRVEYDFQKRRRNHSNR